MSTQYGQVGLEPLIMNRKMSNFFDLIREIGSIYNFQYIAECHRKRLIKIRTATGAYESVRKLVASFHLM
jgi:hypothetical protein